MNVDREARPLRQNLHGLPLVEFALSTGALKLNDVRPGTRLPGQRDALGLSTGLPKAEIREWKTWRGRVQVFGDHGLAGESRYVRVRVDISCGCNEDSDSREVGHDGRRER